MLAQSGALRWLGFSVYLRLGAIKLAFFVSVQWGMYAVAGEWVKLTWLWWVLISFYGAAAALELWLQTDSAKGILAPIGARLNKSRIWRELNKPQIENSPSLTVIVLLSLYLAMIAVGLTVMGVIVNGFQLHGTIDTFLGAWPIFAIIAGFGTLWLIFYHAGIDPTRAIDKLFLWGSIHSPIYRGPLCRPGRAERDPGTHTPQQN